MARKGIRERRPAGKKLGVHELSQKRLELKKNLIEKKRGVAQGSLEKLTQMAQQASSKFQQQKAEEIPQEDKIWSVQDTSRKAYMKELRKVVENADVIIEVLDARDPMGCRNREIEDQVVSCSGKKLVLLMNKIDLVPHEVLLPWLTELRKDFPTIAFKASTQDQGRNLAQTSGKADKAVSKLINSSKSVGTDTLMQLLKNYCRKSSIKTAITVGIIGYPNVGKSSVINSLKRNKAVGVSSTAGYTKVMQEILLDRKIKLLDCPGIVFDNSDSGALLLRNCLNTETLSDPVPAVEVILSRCTFEQVKKIYNVQPYNDIVHFLVDLGRQRGKLGRGGVPDLKATARLVLQDWNAGRIPFYTEPPKSSNTVVDTQIVTNFSSDFNIEKVLNCTSEKVDDEPQAAQPQCSMLTANRFPIIHDSDSDESETEEEMESTKQSLQQDRKVKVPVVHQQKDVEDELNPQTARIARKQAKKLRKDKRRAHRRLDPTQEDEFCETLDMFTFSREDDSDLEDL